MTTAREAMHKERERCAAIVAKYLDTKYLKAELAGITPLQTLSVKSVAGAIVKAIKSGRK